MRRAEQRRTSVEQAATFSLSAVLSICMYGCPSAPRDSDVWKAATSIADPKASARLVLEAFAGCGRASRVATKPLTDAKNARERRRTHLQCSGVELLRRREQVEVQLPGCQPHGRAGYTTATSPHSNTPGRLPRHMRAVSKPRAQPRGWG